MKVIDLLSLSTDISEKSRKEIDSQHCKKARKFLFNLNTYRPNNLTFNQSVATSVRLRKEKSVLR